MTGHALSPERYAPTMYPIRNWNELKRLQVNKEAEIIVPDRIMPPIDNRRIVREIRARRPKKFEPGLYNFVRKNIIGPFLP